MAPTLETLPWLVLSRVCEYLDEPDDSFATHPSRRNLWAFSLTSRQCCAAANSQRFSQVRVEASTPEKLDHLLTNWTEILDRDGGRYRFVKRLKIAPVLPPSDEEDGDERPKYLWDDALLDMPHFCRPASPFPQGISDSAPADTLGPYVTILAQFIRRFPALADLVWGFCPIPREVLAAVHDVRTCRLHMHRFHLSSAIVPRGHDPQVVTLNPDDYALATSPALHSIVVTFRHNPPNPDELNCTEEVIRGMVAGAAPNLQHVWLVPAAAVPNKIIIKSPAPSTRPFSPEGRVGSSLRSLLSTRMTFISKPTFDFSTWAPLTDVSKLRSLALHCDSTPVADLADMAARGELASLETLRLVAVRPEHVHDLRRMLSVLSQNSLRDLRLRGHIDEGLFDIIRERHGKSLLRLSLDPIWQDHKWQEAGVQDEVDSDDDDAPPPLMVLTPIIASQLAEQCPNLELASFPVLRTLGDASECAVYRGLARLPRLQRLSLTLCNTVSRERNTDPNVEEDEPDYISREHLIQLIANAAVDGNLAHAIFNVICSQNNRLRQLQLVTEHVHGRAWDFHSRGRSLSWMLSWFARPWLCNRRDGYESIQMLHYDEIMDAGAQWGHVASEPERYQAEDFIEAFGAIWPKTGERWWENWRSMPLRLEDSETIAGSR
ncbi:hypothetical protein B0T16DRAFT_407963 [Cercophora newfieldiana]|uniref:Uncharacterized protein n=1 Tax=Cercophora newfieldiana TaxID=92897 RepID=A0AA39Y9M8_9PEZI|nr:hypothetical protein B0T16DRAFT_407963 [Cercophora newfieldiana]